MVQSDYESTRQGAIMKKKRSNQLWVVVKVESGIPVSAEGYCGKASARRREATLRRQMREAYDSVGTFELAAK